jgi:hypothetical protein
VILSVSRDRPPVPELPDAVPPALLDGVGRLQDQHQRDARRREIDPDVRRLAAIMRSTMGLTPRRP